MRRALLPAAWTCCAGGVYALHRLGSEGRRFVASLTAELLIDVSLRAHPPAKPRRHP